MDEELSMKPDLSQGNAHHVAGGNDFSVVTMTKCGCTLSFTPGSNPVKAWECVHGHTIKSYEPDLD